jgi:type II secretory pathway pseudopilin PulG
MLNSHLDRLHRSGSSDRGVVRTSANHWQERDGEQGFLLLAMVVAIFLILLALSVAAPIVAHQLRREQEVETVRRGNAYVRAIEVYYLKMGHYPTTIDQLEKTNDIRFLRKRYTDPMTGKDDWRVIHLGEAKTTVKGFFGQPLGGIESSGLGSASGMASSGMPSSGTSTPTFGSPSSSPSSTFGSPSSSPGSTFGSPSSGSGTSGSSSSGTDALGGTAGSSSSGISGTTGPIVGVGLAKEGNSIMTLNEQTTYSTWEFLYDPRIEQLKAQVNIFGGGMTSTSSSDLGSASGSKSDMDSLGSSSNSNSNSSSGGQTGNGTSGGSAPPPPSNPPQ